MFLVSYVPRGTLDRVEDELSRAAVAAQADLLTFGIFTDGRFSAPHMAVLIPESGREAIESILPGEWVPCPDAAEFHWFKWAGGPFAHAQNELTPARDGMANKLYPVKPATDPLPLFA